MRIPAAAGVLCSQTGLTRRDSLQIPFTDEVPNGVKVSECITLNPHRPFSLTPFFFPRSLRLLIRPPSLPLNAPLSSQIHGPRLASSAGSEMTFKPSSECAVLPLACEVVKVMEIDSIGPG